MQTPSTHRQQIHAGTNLSTNSMGFPNPHVNSVSRGSTHLPRASPRQGLAPISVNSAPTGFAGYGMSAGLKVSNPPGSVLNGSRPPNRSRGSACLFPLSIHLLTLSKLHSERHLGLRVTQLLCLATQQHLVRICFLMAIAISVEISEIWLKSPCSFSIKTDLKLLTMFGMEVEAKSYIVVLFVSKYFLSLSFPYRKMNKDYRRFCCVVPSSHMSSFNSALLIKNCSSTIHL